MLKYKSLICYILCFLFICGFVNPVQASSDEEVTDKTLLLLAITSYYKVEEKNGEVVSAIGELEKIFKGVFFKNLNGWVAKDYSIEDCIGDNYGFSAITYKKGNDLVVAFRGTDSGVFKENKWYLCPFAEHPQAKFACQYMKKILDSDLVDDNTKIYLTGHSLGGYLTLNVLGKFYEDEKFKSKFVRAVTFNGLGIGFTESPKMQRVLSSISEEKIVNYRIEWDIVSKVGRHFTKMITFKCKRFLNSSISNLMYNIMISHELYNFLDVI